MLTNKDLGGRRPGGCCPVGPLVDGGAPIPGGKSPAEEEEGGIGGGMKGGWEEGGICGIPGGGCIIPWGGIPGGCIGGGMLAG